MSEFNGLGSPSNALKPQNNTLDDCKESLHVVIEQQIIPRLLNVQQFFPGNVQQAVQALEDSGLDAQPEFQAFTQHCLSGDAM